MKLLLTADWHLGISLHNHSMHDEQVHALNQLCDILQHHRADALVIAGDVFDTQIATAQSIELLSRTLSRICGDLRIPTLMIAGNHDGAVRLSMYGALLSRGGLHIAGRASDMPPPVVIGDTACFLLPYLGIDEARALHPDRDATVGLADYASAYAAVVANLRDLAQTAPYAGLCKVLVGHAYVSGAALSDSDNAAVLGALTAVPADVFDGFDYVLLGHLHRAQRVRRNIFYGGSPLRYSFGEASHVKCVTLLDTTSGDKQAIAIEPLYGMRVLRGTRAALLDTLSPCDDYVKVELTDSAVGGDLLDVLRSMYPRLLCVTGTVHPTHNALSYDDLSSLDPRALVSRYFAEQYGEQPDDDVFAVFDEALHTP